MVLFALYFLLGGRRRHYANKPHHPPARVHLVNFGFVGRANRYFAFGKSLRIHKSAVVLRGLGRVFQYTLNWRSIFHLPTVANLKGTSNNCRSWESRTSLG
jgi:hypothetical protein